MKTINEMIAVMQGFKAGKKVEASHRCGGSWCYVINPCWDWTAYDFRLKPEPKTRLVSMREVPFPCIIRNPGFSDTVPFVYRDVNECFDTAFGIWCINVLAQNGATYSADRKTWHPFTVEVME